MILTREQLEQIDTTCPVEVMAQSTANAVMETALAYHDLRDAVLALHKPFRIYDECDHAHEEGDLGVVNCWDFLTCEDAYLYSICLTCCCDEPDGTDQTESCATYHKHGKDVPICATVQAAESVGGEPRD